jgi:alpha-glucosidase
VPFLFEDPELRNEPVAKPGKNELGDPYLESVYTQNLPDCHVVLREMRSVTGEFPDGVLVGEAYESNVKALARMYGPKHDELQLPMDTQYGFGSLSAPRLREKLAEAETQLNGGTPLLVFNNHDQPRSFSRFADGKHDDALARLVATAILTPKATALLYYGEEIGMENNDPKRKEDVRDIVGIKGWPKYKGRDGERTPMQWTAGTYAGFGSSVMPWLPVGPDYKTRNVEVESKDPGSMLNYYKALIRLRKTNPALREGQFTVVNGDDPDVLAFVQKANDGSIALVVMNCSAEAHNSAFQLGAKTGTVLIGSFAKTGDGVDLSRVSLPPYGSLVISVGK